VTSGEHLRERAQALRAMARGLEQCGLDGVRLRAGHDTWIGPTAGAFVADLDAWRSRLSFAAGDLIGHAGHLERLADTADLAPASALAADSLVHVSGRRR
jgi:hypothetical protein